MSYTKIRGIVEKTKFSKGGGAMIVGAGNAEAGKQKRVEGVDLEEPGG